MQFTATPGALIIICTLSRSLLRAVLKILRELKVDFIGTISASKYCIYNTKTGAFPDPPGGSFRHKLAADYKANRKAAPDVRAHALQGDLAKA